MFITRQLTFYFDLFREVVECVLEFYWISRVCSVVILSPTRNLVIELQTKLNG